MTRYVLVVCLYLCLHSPLFGDNAYVSLPTNSGPMASDVDPDANIAVVADRNSNSISIIDLSNNSVKTTIAVGTTPTSVAINPRTHQAVVTNFGSDDISIVDLETEQVVDTVQVGNSPRDVAIDTDNNVAIVANLNDNSISMISLDTGGDLLPTPITVGSFPISVGYNAVNHTALVANYQDGTVSVIDLTKKIKVGDISVGTNPVDIAVCSDLNRAVVANYGSSSASVIQLTDYTVVATLTVGSRPYGVAINPKTQLAAAVSNGDQTITLIYLGDGFYSDLTHDANEIDHRNQKLPMVITGVGDNPIHLSINPNNNTAITSNISADRLTIVPLGSSAAVPFAVDTAQYRSNLLLSNLGWEDATIEMELHDKDGNLLGAGLVRVPSNGFKQINNINRMLLGSSSLTNTDGIIRLSCDQPFTSVLSLIDNTSNDPSMIVGSSSGHTIWKFLSLPNTSTFHSQLYVWNSGDTAATVNLTLRDALGATMASKDGVSLPAKGFYFSKDIFFDLASNAQVGSLEVNSPAFSRIVPLVLLQSSTHTGGFLQATPLD
jgi:YVTN family beta-propeller protein